MLFYRIPRTIGVAIPMKATFFITYVMVDGWAGVAGEILRLKPLVIFHLKNFFLVKTEKDREEAMDPGSIGFDSSEPQIQLYFLLGLVYAVVTPFLLPFILIFFVLAYVVYRHQVRFAGTIYFWMFGILDINYLNHFLLLVDICLFCVNSREVRIYLVSPCTMSSN